MTEAENIALAAIDEIQALKAQIAELEQERDEQRKHRWEATDAVVEEVKLRKAAEAQIAELEQERDALLELTVAARQTTAEAQVAALREYVQHKEGCTTTLDVSLVERQQLIGCTCGLAAALAGNKQQQIGGTHVR